MHFDTSGFKPMSRFMVIGDGLVAAISVRPSAAGL